MKKIIPVLLMSGCLSFQSAFAEHSEAKLKVTPAAALHSLLEGNKHFAEKGNMKHLEEMASVKHRAEVATGQKPFAVVITCSDSRVPPELLFDKGLGEIFVVRIAGNVVGSHELGSVEYAVEHLGAQLVMVLGHERCGAVTATYDAHLAGSKAEGNIGSLLTSIEPAVQKTLAHGANGTKAEIIEQCTQENIRLVAEELSTQSPILREEVEKGHIQIVTAYYDLDKGTVTVIK